jgi:hypothetical protein
MEPLSTVKSIIYTSMRGMGGSMEEKDKVEAYISLYKQQMERYGKTQDIEWKGNFGVWALLAGASFLAAKEPVTLSHCTTGLVLWLTVVVHGIWLHNIHSSERFD